MASTIENKGKSLPSSSTTRHHPSPEDWRDHAIYLVMVDRFNNPHRPPRSRWDADNREFQGGCLVGITAELEYIRKLGCGAIWLTPVQKNLPWEGFSYHGYGIHDYLTIEPRFASDPEAARRDPEFAGRELRALVARAHELGLYVIMDVVLNHVGNVFGYAAGPAGEANGSRPYKGDGDPYPIYWREEHGIGLPPANTLQEPPSRDAAVWPAELQDNECFRRRGGWNEDHPREGDFDSLKELMTDASTNGGRIVRDTIIRCYQKIIEVYDVDAFRIDALRHIEPDYGRVFANAIREYALSIGKRNFFIFGEVAADDETIAKYVGRNSQVADPSGVGSDIIGVDAAMDFPLRNILPAYAKAQGRRPDEIASMYRTRRRLESTLITSHAEASRYFVTFLDNHDTPNYRFTPQNPPGTATYDGQFSLGFGCLLALQGIPCVYYGSEQGLTGIGAGGEHGVREALWGKGAAAFDPQFKYYRELRRLFEVRAKEPALRYGRQYFRPLSGDGRRFALSSFPDGVLAFSRVLADREVLIVANASTTATVRVSAIVDPTHCPAGTTLRILYSNQVSSKSPEPVAVSQGDNVIVIEPDGSVHTRGPVSSVRVELLPMEIQFLAR